VEAEFGRLYGGRPEVVARAPGRVELLGNHTDYNGGLVMSAAIDRETFVAGRRRGDGSCRSAALEFGEQDAFDAASIEPTPAGSWSRYVRGVCWALGERFGGVRAGFEAAFAGDVPLGGGLSSSASLQASWGRFLVEAGCVDMGPGAVLEGPAGDGLRMELAKALRRSENAFVGVGSGLLDQFSSLFGVAGHALTLDCLSLEHGVVPLGDPAPALVVCDSKTSRRLADGMYDRRVAECATVVEHFRERVEARGGPLLRHVRLEELEAEWDRLDPVGRRRARHVVTENARVVRGAEALRRGDLAAFGRLMSESHASSRDDFENSSPALDALIEAASEAPGFLGGKLSGAGWAGCTVNLVEPGRAEAFAGALHAGYARRTGVEPEVLICRAADGARAWRLA
jgi:galactokinase